MKGWWETIILALNPRTRTASISSMIYSVATRHQDSATSSCMWEQRQNSVFFSCSRGEAGVVCHTAECLGVCACVFVSTKFRGLARNMQAKVLWLLAPPQTNRKPSLTDGWKVERRYCCFNFLQWWKQEEGEDEEGRSSKPASIYERK
jgi:hypothetical protein